MTTAERLEKNYLLKGGKGAFPWQAIIDAIMKYLPAILCPTAKAVKRFARNHPVAVQAMLSDAFKSEGTFTSGNNAKAAVSAAYDTLLAMDNDELQSYIDAQ